jgi:hypothetical protein
MWTWEPDHDGITSTECVWEQGTEENIYVFNF